VREGGGEGSLALALRKRKEKKCKKKEQGVSLAAKGRVRSLKGTTQKGKESTHLFFLCQIPQKESLYMVSGGREGPISPSQKEKNENFFGGGKTCLGEIIPWKGGKKISFSARGGGGPGVSGRKKGFILHGGGGGGLHNT